MRLIGSAGGWRLDRWSALAALATGAVAALVSLRRVHTDDLEVIRAVVEVGYAELWTEPFRDLYYRPLTSTVVKLGVDTVGANALLRIAGALLVAASAWMLAAVAREQVGPARLGGVLCLLAAPFTFVAVAPFGVGIGDSIVGLALLVAIRDSQIGARRAPWVSIAAVAVALAAKESGLVVAAYVMAEHARRRQLAFTALVASLAGTYLIAHAAMVEPRPYILRTGYLFDMLSVAEQRQRFADQPLPLRLYNAAANFFSALCYLPYQGQLRLSPSIAGFAAVTGGTAVLVGAFALRSGERGRWWPLLATIPANAALGFAYARPRIMFVGYVAIAVLLALALDHRWRRGSRRLVAAALVSWAAVLVSTLARLAQMP